MTLPYSRTVNVTVSKNTGFPSRRGFGVLLFLTSQEVAGELDASNLTKAYGSIEEVAADFSSTDDFYKAALAAFSQNPRPLQIKAGYYNRGEADPTPTDIQTAMDAIEQSDSNWYWLTIEPLLRDKNTLDGLITWIEARNKMMIADSNDVFHETLSDTSSFSARHKDTVERTAVFYHTDSNEFPGVALSAKLSTFNFDDANTAYTGKFKNLAGISPVNIGSDAVQSVTGFVPQIGQSTASGHLANTYVDIGGKNLVVEGSTLTPNVFIDEIHATDWIIARTEEEILGILMNNNRVPFTDQGMQLLASAPRNVMELARRSGLVAEDLNPLTGEYEASVEVTVPSVFDVPESQRKARIAPAIEIKFRYASAVHYSTINYSISF